MPSVRRGAANRSANRASNYLFMIWSKLMNGANIKATNRARGKSRGQALPIIALSMLVLVAIVGLAVDGGSAYGQRRKAQNAADGVALAGTREMLRHYQQMIIDYRFDVDGTAAKEDLVKEMIDDYAAKNGITVN